jgi:Fe(3+) dicitrate transport protein
VSRIFFAGPTTQEVSVGYRYLKEAMREQSTRLALIDNVPTVTPTSDGHVFQDRSGGTEASAYYIDDKIDVGNWTITPGIRFEHINTDWRDRPVLDANNRPVPEKNRSITSNEPLPALSVMYHLSDAWKLFANYETSFGSLQYFQLGQGGSGNSTANGLEPEKAKTYEIGTRYDNGGFAGELTAFYIDFDDELQYISNDVGWTNLGATKHQGIEASARYDLAGLDPRLDGLSVSGGYTYTRATYEGDIRASRAATCRSIHARWPLPGALRRSTAGPGTWMPCPIEAARAGHRDQCRRQLQWRLHHRAECRRAVWRYSGLRDLACPRWV